MEEIKVSEIIKWEWQCDCGEYNIEEDDPVRYAGRVVCQTCDKEFKPIPE